jgi:hypothetical protein
MKNPAKQPAKQKTAQLFHAVCSTCSWGGREFTSRTDADNDGDGHEIAVGDNKQHHYTRVVPEV